jgi:hypothetical protein
VLLLCASFPFGAGVRLILRMRSGRAGDAVPRASRSWVARRASDRWNAWSMALSCWILCSAISAVRRLVGERIVENGARGDGGDNGRARGWWVGLLGALGVLGSGLRRGVRGGVLGVDASFFFAWRVGPTLPGGLAFEVIGFAAVRLSTLDFLDAGDCLDDIILLALRTTSGEEGSESDPSTAFSS